MFQNGKVFILTMNKDFDKFMDIDVDSKNDNQEKSINCEVKEIIVQGLNPSQNVYYVDAGPEGKIVVLDLNMIPLSVILACIAWEHDIKSESNYPSLEFNKTGFRY